MKLLSVFPARWVSLLVLSTGLAGLSGVVGCNDGGGGGSDDTAEEATADTGSSDDSTDTPSSVSRDIGDNNPNLLAAIGDSITAGSTLSGASYPQRLSGILGRTVQNRGVPGSLSSAAPSQAQSALAQNPAYLLIMLGTNDIFREVPPDTVANNVAIAVRLAKANRTIPVVATLPPILRNDFQNGFVASINSRLKSMAAREGALLADVNREFGSGTGLIQADGFHPNETGAQIIAFAFADAIR